MIYNYQNDWRILKAQDAVPKEIIQFLEDVFQIIEVRQRIGIVKGIKFEIRPREHNHSKPHIHAEYDGYHISIEIETGRVLAGNLPHSQLKIAKKWVQRHKDYLLGEWNSIAVSATTLTTKSRLDYMERCSNEPI